MKKFISILFSLFLITAISCETKAQVNDFTGTDTIEDAATVNIDLQLKNSAANVAVQSLITKVSGTVAGTCLLQGSLDGTNFSDITTDTFTLANVATQNKLWDVAPNKYLHYRITCTGSGTMAAISSGKALRRD